MADAERTAEASLTADIYDDPLALKARRALFLVLPSVAAKSSTAKAETPRKGGSGRAARAEERRRMLSAAVESGDGVRLGTGSTRTRLGGALPEKVPLGEGSLLDAGLIRQHQPRECEGAGWPRRIAKYGAMTRFGVLVMAGTAAEARAWAQSLASQLEVEPLRTGGGGVYVLFEGHVIAHLPDERCATVDDGHGHVLTAEGEVYCGALRLGLYHGAGACSYVGGETFEGTFVDGLKQGRGTVTSPDGYTFIGEYRDGQRHGPGRIFLAQEEAGARANGQGHGPLRAGAAPAAARECVCDGYWEAGRFVG